MSVIKKVPNPSFFKVSNLIELLSDPSFVLLITVVLSIALPKFIKKVKSTSYLFDISTKSGTPFLIHEIVSISNLPYLCLLLVHFLSKLKFFATTCFKLIL